MNELLLTVKSCLSQDILLIIEFGSNNVITVSQEQEEQQQQ